MFLQPAINFSVAFSIMALPSPLYFVFALSTLIVPSEVEHAKVLPSMLVVPAGIAILERPENANALDPKDLTEVGIVIDVNVEILRNALSPIAVTSFGIVVFLQPATRVLFALVMIALLLL